MCFQDFSSAGTYLSRGTDWWRKEQTFFRVRKVFSEAKIGGKLGGVIRANRKIE